MNLPSDVPAHASLMYSKNICNFLTYLAADGKIAVNLDDEITRDTLITRDGKVINPRVQQLLARRVRETHQICEKRRRCVGCVKRTTILT